VGLRSRARVCRPLPADLNSTSEWSPSRRSCHTNTTRRFGSQLSIADTLPPAYKKHDTPTMSDNKPPSSCPECGNSTYSGNLDHSAQTLDVVVSAPTETPTEAPTAAELIQARMAILIPKLETARKRFNTCDRKWQSAAGKHAHDAAYAMRTLFATELEKQSLGLEAIMSWGAEVGTVWSEVRGSMSALGIDRETQDTVCGLWQRMEEERGRTDDL
jgi:hypothetical protein